jgi:redox-sensitive bicupin YhaK (pirin superfamily)
MLERIIEQRRRNVGGGMEVGRVLPFAEHRMVGPHIFCEHMGPLEFAPGVDRSVDVGPHPHIGLWPVARHLSGRRRI